MIALLVWLCLSHGLLIGVGAALWEANAPVAGLLFLLVLPAARIFWRFRGKGYYLIGYIGEVGGDRPGYSGWVHRRHEPIRFRLCLLMELAVVGFLWFGVIARAGA